MQLMQKQKSQVVQKSEQNLKLRREIKADIRKQHDLYVNNLVGDVKANPKDFYQYINSQKKDAKDIHPLKKRNGGGVAQSESEKAAEFNGQFSDVFTKSESVSSLFWIDHPL